MLLTFDEGEVRKIVAVCRGVIKYLQVAEVVERMEDLITFVKNLTPGVTNMAKQVEARAKELTHVAHADILDQRVASVKKMIPLLISSIKTFVTTGTGNPLRGFDLITHDQCAQTRFKACCLVLCARVLPFFR